MTHHGVKYSGKAAAVVGIQVKKKAIKTLQRNNIFIKSNKLLNKENIHLYLFNLIF